MKQKRIKPLFLLLFFALALSCGKPAVEKPEHLIPEDRMVSILYDLAILNSAKGISAKSFQEEGVLPEAHIYEKYGIDSARFAGSVKYYASKTDVYIAIQKNVEARLQEAKLRAEEAKKISDSLKELKRPNRDSLLLQRKQDTSRLKKT